MKWYFSQDITKDSATVAGDENKHLTLVMRTRAGDGVICFDGNGKVAESFVEETGKNKSVLKVQTLMQHQRPKTELVLAAAAIKGDRQDTLIRQATELGATKIVLLETERSEVRLKDEKKDKVVRQLVACCKQCHRPFLPEIDFGTIEQVCSKCSDYVKIFGDIGAKSTILDQDFEKLANSNVVVFVGPEGGFSEGEEQLLAKSGAIGVSLGQNILRADTACSMLISLIKAIKKW